MKKGRDRLAPRHGLFSYKQTPGLIATGWSRWKKDAHRTALRAAILPTRAYPKNWSSRRNLGQKFGLSSPGLTAPKLHYADQSNRFAPLAGVNKLPQGSGTLHSNFTSWNSDCADFSPDAKTVPRKKKIKPDDTTSTTFRDFFPASFRSCRRGKCSRQKI